MIVILLGALGGPDRTPSAYKAMRLDGPLPAIGDDVSLGDGEDAVVVKRVWSADCRTCDLQLGLPKPVVDGAPIPGWASTRGRALEAIGLIGKVDLDG